MNIVGIHNVLPITNAGDDGSHPRALRPRSSALASPSVQDLRAAFLVSGGAAAGPDDARRHQRRPRAHRRVVAAAQPRCLRVGP